MSYSELIKNFGRIRDYMREFYVCGFKSREEYDRKSARSYDDERRRIESWLGDYMGFVKTTGGKTFFLPSIAAWYTITLYIKRGRQKVLPTGISHYTS